MRIHVVSRQGSWPAQMCRYDLPPEIEHRLYGELKRHKNDPNIKDSLDIILRGTEYQGWRIILIEDLIDVLKKNRNDY